MKILQITWRDAVGEDGWIDTALAGQTTLATIESVGFFVREDDESVTITMAHDEDNDKFGAYMVIPKVNITKRKVLKK